MSIKLLLLKSGETLIADAKELISKDGNSEPYAYFLSNPHLSTTRQKYIMIEDNDIQTDSNNFGIDVILSPWIVLSQDSDFMIPIDWVVTICSPLSSVEQMYLEKISNIQHQELNKESNFNE